MTLRREGPRRYLSASQQDTERFGELVAPLLADGDVLVLTGGLGVGKTHFTKGVARGLGDAHPVTSPTFALMAVHDGGRIPLFHFDLYRLEHAYELEDTGIFDVLGYEGACLLEWGEQFQDELTDEFLGVVIARTGESTRTISLEAHGGRAEELAEAIDAAVDAAAGAQRVAQSGFLIDTGQNWCWNSDMHDSSLREGPRAAKSCDPRALRATKPQDCSERSAPRPTTSTDWATRIVHI